VLKCLLKVVRGRASNVPLAISLAYGLAQYYESLGVGLVDCVMENIRVGLEHPYTSSYQVSLLDCMVGSVKGGWPGASVHLTSPMG
jgi:regulator of nonsense transcripts 2